MSLKKNSIFGAAWSILATSFNQIFSFFIFILLAQLLNIDEFGIASFSLIIIEFASIFLSFGINQNLIQKPQLDDAFSSTAFWIMLVVSSFISLTLIFVIAPLVYLTYSRLAALLIITLSIIPIMNGLKLTQNAQMQRNFENKKLATIETVAILAGGGTSVILALKGNGVWALAIGRIVQSGISSLCTWYFSDFRPAFTIDKNHAKEIKTFGLPLFYMALLTFFSGKSINLTIGVLLGPVPFALFNVAMRPFLAVQELTMKQLNKISLAALSRVEDKNIAESYNRIVSLTAFIVLPIYLGLGAVSESFVIALLGAKWQSCIVLMYIIPFTAPAFVFYWYLPTLLISKGFTKSALKINIVVCISNVVIPLLAAYWGVETAVLAFTFAAYVTIPWRFSIVNKHIPLSLRKTLLAVFPFATAGIVMFFFVLGIDRSNFFQFEIKWLELIPLVMLGATSYFAILLILFRKPFLAAICELKSIGVQSS